MEFKIELPDMKKFRKEINDSLAEQITEKLKSHLCPVHHKPAKIRWRGQVDNPEFYAETCCDKLEIDLDGI